MGTHFAIFSILFLFIFLLTPHINTIIYQTILLITRSKKLALTFLLILLLPGTIIHELSHFIVATLLFVRTGELTVIPRLEEGRIKAGSLKHADTDLLRRTAIGLAPMIIGLMIIYLLGGLIFNFSLPTTYHLQPTTFFLLYLLFITSLSMFSSKKDMEVAIFVVPIIFLLILALYINGLTVSFSSTLNQKVVEYITRLNTYLGITFVLNLIIFIVLKSIAVVLQKALKVKVVRVS